MTGMLVLIKSVGKNNGKKGTTVGIQYWHKTSMVRLQNAIIQKSLKPQ